MYPNESIGTPLARKRVEPERLERDSRRSAWQSGNRTRQAIEDRTMTKLIVQYTLLSEAEVKVSNKVLASLKGRSDQGKAVEAILNAVSVEYQTKKPVPEWRSTIIMDQSGVKLFEMEERGII